MTKVRYGFDKTLTETTFDEAVQAVTSALKGEGFGVLTEIDVQKTLKQKIGVDFPRYVILGACNPELAHRALSGEPEIGLLLPCNVVVAEKNDGRVSVAIADPRVLFELVDNPEIRPIADDVNQRLRRVLERI